MSQVINYVPDEPALLQLQRRARFLQESEHSSEMVQVLPPRLRVRDQVFQVYESVLPF